MDLDDLFSAPVPEEDPKLQQLLEDMEEIAKRMKYRAKDFFEPYPKQARFFKMGATKRERLLSAGNQLGKTEAGAFECACHLTGEYPDWWEGFRWKRPVVGWAAGVTGLAVRDTQQTKLFGQFGVEELLGTGMIPRDCIKDKTLARGVSDAFDTVWITHKTNGVEDGLSMVSFKAYEQGREKFQAKTLDFLWFDEEPEEDIYGEGMARITASGGITWTTFTPMKGATNLYKRFAHEPNHPDRGMVVMLLVDAKHIPPEKHASIIAGYPEHEREARTNGTPMQGEGLIFRVSEASIVEPAIPVTLIPLHWLKLWGLDFGIGHPFAAVLILWDRDTDTIHVHHAIRVKDQLPLQHAVPIKAIGASVPVAWPMDGTQRRDDGKPLADHYKRNGLLMLPGHAKHEDGSISTEAGVQEMHERMTTGRFKVAAHLVEWFEEMRGYHRKDGLIVKKDDDLMSATRVAVVMRRFGKAVALGNRRKKYTGTGIADGVDFDLF